VTKILQACDRLTDDSLPELGVKLEDVEGDHAVIKFVDKETLLKEKQQQSEEQEKERKQKGRSQEKA